MLTTREHIACFTANPTMRTTPFPKRNISSPCSAPPPCTHPPPAPLSGAISQRSRTERNAVSFVQRYAATILTAILQLAAPSYVPPIDVLAAYAPVASPAPTTAAAAAAAAAAIANSVGEYASRASEGPEAAPPVDASMPPGAAAPSPVGVGSRASSAVCAPSSRAAGTTSHCRGAAQVMLTHINGMHST